jgi:hypothetical protein
MLVDNHAATRIANGAISQRSRHIRVKCHMVHEAVEEKVILVQHCPAKDQVADIFTKMLSQFIHQKNVEALGLVEVGRP